MKATITFLVAAAAAALLPGQGPASRPAKPRVQLAILLDTSGSMSGLIDQARAQLWTVVNELVRARKGGLMPDLEVGLFEYGKSAIPADQGYLRQILPLTTDLDKVSEELFALTTNGGEEYCGMVIRAAAAGLAWDPSPETLKLVFIAGNEPFTQGPVDFREACREAIGRGVAVNTIHCGAEAEGVKGHWRDGAILADGRFLNIDHNSQVVAIAAPQDQEIARLGQELFKTYIPYGAEGVAGQARQTAQNVNAAKAGGVTNYGRRAVFAANGLYQNGSWDLVDAWRSGIIKLEALKETDLPEEMRKMDGTARLAFLEKKRDERNRLQAAINELDRQRNEFVARKRAEAAKTDNRTLGAAVVACIREQAQGRGFTFE